jgi:metal-responsive CopG/Arc/MetJ family transcriptional regulator
MKDDYALKGKTAKLEVEVESEVAEKLRQMETYSKFSRSELVNTAIKRFIASHKDFMPPAQG